MSDTEAAVLNLVTPAHDEEERIEAAVLEVLRSSRYVPFQRLRGPGRQRPRLLLVPRIGPWEWISNGALWRIRATPDEIGLSYHTAGVLISGRNLLSAALAIDDHHCLFIQAHNPDRHEPPEQGQPVITSIDFFIPKSLPGEGEPGTSRVPRPAH